MKTILVLIQFYTSLTGGSGVGITSIHVDKEVCVALGEAWKRESPNTRSYECVDTTKVAL